MKGQKIVVVVILISIFGNTHFFLVQSATTSTTQSVNVTAKVEVISPPSPPPSGGGPGGVYIPPVVTQVIFIGRAYPKSTVTLLKDAQIATTTVAGADANFQISISGLSGGNYIFSLYSEDREGRRSSLLTFPVSVTAGVITSISGIFIAPTIAVDKSEVKQGDNIAIFGQSAPNAEISIVVNSDKAEYFFGKIKADKDGLYSYSFSTIFWKMGRYYAKSKAALNGEVSPFGKLADFLVGTKTILVEPTPICPPIWVDLNNDCRVNLIDFSILFFWFDKPVVPQKVDLDGNEKADLTDLSILAYYWTG